ncbi:MAG: nucleoside-diphosphate kinase [Patescibacteria group bacterium]|jgi:nucleoside-diphosphate kinase
MERTVVLLKPDALQRNLLGEIISRFEKKGLKVIGLKMMKLSDEVLAEHYFHHRDKPFFGKLVHFMKSAPVIAIALEGLEAIGAVRLLCGPTSGRKADAGSIRGDFAMSSQQNIIHASDSPETAEKEIWRFFNKNEIFDYPKIDSSAIYAEEELEK